MPVGRVLQGSNKKGRGLLNFKGYLLQNAKVLYEHFMYLIDNAATLGHKPFSFAKEKKKEKA